MDGVDDAKDNEVDDETYSNAYVAVGGRQVGSPHSARGQDSVSVEECPLRPVDRRNFPCSCV